MKTMANTWASSMAKKDTAIAVQTYIYSMYLHTQNDTQCAEYKIFIILYVYQLHCMVIKKFSFYK